MAVWRRHIFFTISIKLIENVITLLKENMINAITDFIFGVFFYFEEDLDFSFSKILIQTVTVFFFFCGHRKNDNFVGVKRNQIIYI